MAGPGEPFFPQDRQAGHSLASEAVQSPSMVVFKTQLDEALRDVSWSHGWPCSERPLELPSNPEYPATMSSYPLFVPAVTMRLRETSHSCDGRCGKRGWGERAVPIHTVSRTGWRAVGDEVSEAAQCR